MPLPKKDEKESDFIKRAIKYFMEKEGLNKERAVGKAHGFWRNYKGGIK